MPELISEQVRSVGSTLLKMEHGFVRAKYHGTAIAALLESSLSYCVITFAVRVGAGDPLNIWKYSRDSGRYSGLS